MGRKRRRPAWIIASRGVRPMARKRCSASRSKIPFFVTMPITIIMPMKDATLNVVAVTKRASKPPKVDSNAEARMASRRREMCGTQRATRRTAAATPRPTPSKDRGRISAAPGKRRHIRGESRKANVNRSRLSAPRQRHAPGPHLPGAQSLPRRAARFSRRISVWPASFVIAARIPAWRFARWNWPIACWSCDRATRGSPPETAHESGRPDRSAPPASPQARLPELRRRQWRFPRE